jgi:hypothetical protein
MQITKTFGWVKEKAMQGVMEHLDLQAAPSIFWSFGALVLIRPHPR